MAHSPSFTNLHFLSHQEELPVIKRIDIVDTDMALIFQPSIITESALSLMLLFKTSNRFYEDGLVLCSDDTVRELEQRDLIAASPVSDYLKTRGVTAERLPELIVPHSTPQTAPRVPKYPLSSLI